LVELEPIRKMVWLSDSSKRLETMWNKIVNHGEKVALELSRAERTLLLTGLVYLHERVEAEIRSTPPARQVCR
jgi:hypothetical protein